MIDINSYFKTWSDREGLDLTEIEKNFNSILEEEKILHSTFNEDELKTRALQRVALTLRKLRRSPAVKFEGTIIAVGDMIDFTAKQRRDAIDVFKTDPQLAISQGLTNENGIPLDIRKEWNDGRPNIHFGKPLPEHNFNRTMWGIGVKSSIQNDTPRLFTLNISGNNAEKDNIPMFTPVSFRAIDKTKDTNEMYNLSSSILTNIEIDNTLKLPDPYTLIKKCCSNYIVKLNDLDKYHETNIDNFNRFAIIEGDVSTLNLDIPPTRSSRIMIIEDLSTMESLEGNGLLCWVPLRCNLDFAEQSKVLVMGRTNRGKKKEEQGNLTEEPGNITLNTFGVYAIPEYKIKIETHEETTTTDSW